MKNFFTLKKLLRLGLVVLFFNMLYESYIYLGKEFSGEAAGSFLIGIFCAAIFIIAIAGLGFCYDEIKKWVRRT